MSRATRVSAHLWLGCDFAPTNPVAYLAKDEGADEEAAKRRRSEDDEGLDRADRGEGQQDRISSLV